MSRWFHTALLLFVFLLPLGGREQEPWLDRLDRELTQLFTRRMHISAGIAA